MSQWVIWDEEINGPSSVMRDLPDSLKGRSMDDLNALNYRELVTVRPEDYIPRFPNLSGSAVFELRPDGRVYQIFPDADYSVAAVKEELKVMAARDAGHQLQGTDWYFIRQLETGKEPPEDIVRWRGMVRDHLDWIRNDIDQKGPRELVEYRWQFPSTVDDVMLNGTAVRLELTPPTVALDEDIPPTDSRTVPLMQNVNGIRLDESSLDANDIPAPIVNEPFPYLNDAAPKVDDPQPHLRATGPVVPAGDIRTMNQEERDRLAEENPDEYARQMELERQRAEAAGRA